MPSPRNWPSILIDAGLRGLTINQLAAEQRTSPRLVSLRARSYGVRLTREAKRDYPRVGYERTEAEKARRRQESAWLRLTDDEWVIHFIQAERANESLNEFVRRVRCSPGAAKSMAASLGHAFRPTGIVGGRSGRRAILASIAAQAQQGDTALSLAKRTRQSKQTVLKAAAHYGITLRQA